jgi:hypothetical protein
LEGAVIRSLPSTALDSAEAVAADELHALLSGYPIDASRQALALAAAHFKLPSKRERKPRIDRMIAAAERGGENVTSITTPDGVTLHFGKGESTEASNPWLDDLRVTKQ